MANKGERAYLISLADAGAQNDCMQTLKSNGVAVIQSASGLCVKTSLSAEKLKELLGGLSVKAVSGSDADLSADVRKFIES